MLKQWRFFVLETQDIMIDDNEIRHWRADHEKAFEAIIDIGKHITSLDRLRAAGCGGTGKFRECKGEGIPGGVRYGRECAEDGRG